MTFGRFAKLSSGFEVLPNTQYLVMSYAQHPLQSAVPFYTASCLLPEVSMLIFLPACISLMSVLPLQIVHTASVPVSVRCAEQWPLQGFSSEILRGWGFVFMPWLLCRAHVVLALTSPRDQLE